MTEQEGMRALIALPKERLEKSLQCWMRARDTYDEEINVMRAEIERLESRRNAAQSECSRYGAALANKKP